MAAIEKSLRQEGVAVLRGGDFDRWDLEVRGGMFGSARLIMGIEEFGGGKQLVRYRIWPHFSSGGLYFLTVWFSLSVLALIDRTFIATLVLGSLVILTIVRMLFESIAPMALLRRKSILSKKLKADEQLRTEKTDLDIV